MDPAWGKELELESWELVILAMQRAWKLYPLTLERQMPALSRERKESHPGKVKTLSCVQMRGANSHCQHQGKTYPQN